jgi:hypothetical protein
MAAQLAVLRDIVVNPLRATALGRHENEDLIDLLLRVVPQSCGPIKQAQVMCLMSFDDPRVTDYLVAEFSRSRDPATILHLGKRLSLARGAEFFRPYLWSQNTAQALAAARHCSQGLELSPKERLRVAVLLDQDFEPPGLSERTLDMWMDGLAGRDRVRVRQLAEQRGEEVLILWTRLSALAAAEQDWLVATTARLNPTFLKARLPDLLSAPSVSVLIVEQALQLGVELPPSLLQSERDLVRATAISAGLADDRLETFLAPQTSAGEAAAAARRCSVERLVELFSDPRWEVRAAATETLARRELQELPLETLRRKTASTFVGERVAAVELLRRLEDTQWLQDNLGPAANSSSSCSAGESNPTDPSFL